MARVQDLSCKQMGCFFVLKPERYIVYQGNMSKDEVEQWRVVDEAPSYEVSTLGNVRHIKRGHLNPIQGDEGYLDVNLCRLGDKKIRRRVHRLVLAAWIPNPEEKPCVDHINRIRSDNRLENLRWVTHAENNENQERKDIRRGRAIVQLSKDKPPKLIKTWDSITQAATALDLSHDSIGKVCGGKPNFRSCGGFIWKYQDQYVVPKDEIWRPIPWSKEGDEVSSLGRVRTQKRGVLNLTETNGYLSFDAVSVHRIVVEAFPELCPRQDGQNVVNHKNGNKLNNAVSNLEWKTIAGNVEHALNTGLTGTRKPVRRTLPNGSTIDYISVSEASRESGTSASCISEACRGNYKQVCGDKWQFIQDIETAEMDAYIDGLLSDA
jgi:hypothetical protein